MAQSSPIIWMPVKIAKHLPVVKVPEPVQVWDPVARTFLDESVKDAAGLPVWRLQVLLGLGWSGDLAPVEVRVASATRPDIAPNPQALLSFLGVDASVAGSAQTLPQRRP